MSISKKWILSLSIISVFAFRQGPADRLNLLYLNGNRHTQDLDIFNIMEENVEAANNKTKILTAFLNSYQRLIVHLINRIEKDFGQQEAIEKVADFYDSIANTLNNFENDNDSDQAKDYIERFNKLLNTYVKTDYPDEYEPAHGEYTPEEIEEMED